MEDTAELGHMSSAVCQLSVAVSVSIECRPFIHSALILIAAYRWSFGRGFVAISLTVGPCACLTSPIPKLNAARSKIHWHNQNSVVRKNELIQETCDLSSGAFILAVQLCQFVDTESWVRFEESSSA